MNAEDYAWATARRLGREVRRIPGMGVDPAYFPPASAPERMAARAALGLEATETVLVYAAEFSLRKNQTLGLSLLSHWHTAHPERQLRLLLPGDGELLTFCRDKAHSLGLGHLAIFPGYRADIRPYYLAADIALSTSLSEGLPFHLVEAMTCGLPVLATDIKGHRELVTSGCEGYLYPPGAPEIAVRQGELLAEAPQARGVAARLKAADYSLAKVFPEITGIYQQFLS
jgi:glycosyltransferase EpsD